ncbi:MAG: hypothetical protein WCP06_04640 [Verrucomicrobiota bacterium]
MIFENLELLVQPQAGSYGAALNMAVDEVLLIHARNPVLRVYGWARPAVSFGYFEPWAPVAQAHPDREWVRRWTGGGVVLHGEDWTYSIIVPRDLPFARVGAAESYRLLHELLAGAMRRASLPGMGGMGGGDVALTPESAHKISHACFENPAQYDVLLAGQKIAGAAQRRSRWGMLHQGSVQGVALTGNFADCLAGGLAKTVTTRSFSPDALAEAEELAATKYGTEEWQRRF